MGDDSTPKEHKGHKRQSSNSFDNNQNSGPRGDTPAKFRRESFGDRSPFNRGGNNRGFRGGDRGFRGGGRGGGRGGFRGNGSPSNFNRGGFRGSRGFNNSRGGFRGNRGFNNSNRGGFRDGNDRQSFNSDKPWQQRNNFQNRDNKKTDFEENDAASNKNKKKMFVDDEQPEQLIENGSDVEESGSGSEDSGSEDEMVPQQQNGTTNGAVDETDSSDSEDEEEDSVEGEQPEKSVKNEAMDSSESEEEIEVNNSSKVQKQEESSSDDEMEANGAQDDSDSDSEEKELASARENNENKNKAAKASTTNSTTHGANEPNPCKIVISRFPPTLKKVHIQKFFEKYGEVREVSLRIKQYDIFGYVIFETPEAAVRALEVNGMQYEGRIISVQQPWASGTPMVEPDRTVCLLHVYGTFRETLWNLFEPLCGPIETVLVLGGTAYIQFESPDSKQIALHMKHVVVDGKSYKIVESPQRTFKPREKFDSRGKFGPRGRFGGKPGVRRFDNHSNYTSNAPRWSRNSYNTKGSGKEIKIMKNKDDNSFTIKIGS